jgi:hypothetical protein
MLIREFGAVVGLFIVTLILSVLYGALLVHNLEKVVPLSGVVRKVILGVVFFGMLFVNFRYFFCWGACGVAWSTCRDRRNSSNCRLYFCFRIVLR